MKNFLRKISSLAMVMFFMNSVFGQAPQSFTFQAVARNSSNELISDVSVSVRLSLSASDQTTVWQETHSIQTSDLGLFTVKAGAGTRVGGTLTSFDQVDWESDTYSLKVEIDVGSGWEDMGASDLLSVPYALNAASIGQLESLDVVEAADNPAEESLFEVRNKNGQTLFAVYNEGVRINVDDTQGKSKGPKGGFAIGGFDNTKGLTYELFRVTPDSVRVYVDVGATKGPKGGFAIGGFDRAKGLTADFLHLSEDNYFIGYESGINITTGLYNSFFGYKAGVMNTSGGNNVFIGNETGYSNTDGNWNIFMGNSSGYANTTGSGNIILGDAAGTSNVDGSWNVFIGDLAGYSNTGGESNVYIGSDAGFSSTIASYNVFMGSTAGYNNVDGSSNVFLGESSGYSNYSGTGNVFMGTESGYSNDDGDYNVFIGEVAGWANVSGIDNVFIGASAGESNTLGGYNVFIGTETGNGNTEGIGNVFIGQEAGTLNSTGDLNVAIGPQAGYYNIVGDNNVFMGYQAGLFETGSNTLYIDNAGNTWDQALIYGEFLAGNLLFYADVYTAGVLSAADVTVTSDKSAKTNITELPSVLDKLIQLRPVEFDWLDNSGVKGAETKGRQVGLIAQEVEEIFPDAVVLNRKDQKSISYINLSVRFLKALQEQQQIIDQLSQENNDLKTRLNDLESKVNSMLSPVAR